MTMTLRQRLMSPPIAFYPLYVVFSGWSFSYSGHHGLGGSVLAGLILGVVMTAGHGIACRVMPRLAQTSRPPKAIGREPDAGEDAGSFRSNGEPPC